MMPRSVQKNVILGFGAALGLLLLVDAVAVLTLNRLSGTVRWQMHAYEVLDDLDDLLSLLQDAETGQRGFLLTGDEVYLEPYRAAAPATEADLAELRSLTTDNAAHQQRLDRLAPLVRAKLAELHETIELRRMRGLAAALDAVETGDGKRTMDEIRTVIAAMKADEHTLLQERAFATAASTRRSTTIIVAGSVLGALLLVAALLIIHRDERERAAAEDALRHAHDELEARVSARTSELALVNTHLHEEIAQRVRAEASLADVLAQLRGSYEDIVSILDRLDLAVALTGAEGQITYLSTAGQRLAVSPNPEGMGWTAAFSFSEADRRRLEALMRQPAAARQRVAVRLDRPTGRHYWLEIEVLDHPRERERRLLFFRDVTEIYDLRRRVGEPAALHDLVGASEPMRRLFQTIHDLAQTDATVLIEGETGTGKELTARAIHKQSLRRAGPFIAVHAASLTESLLASQLFGHRRGAFTGAVTDQPGFFEAAAGGTLFLDEIGDIPYELQTALLRVLQEKEVVRVGETEPRPVDIRVLAASQHDLQHAAAHGRFRADLLYRIRVGRILLPPLRDRRDDIPLLVARFLEERKARSTKRIEGFSTEAMALLLDHPWPGNVRELKSAVEFACIRAESLIVQRQDLPPEVLHHEDGAEPSQESAERQQFLDALARTGGNRKAAARLLGISRATLYRRLSALGIPRDRAP